MKLLKGFFPAARYLLPVVISLLLNPVPSAGKGSILARSNLVQSSSLEHSISKRNVADLVVTDRSSRRNSVQSRKMILHRLLLLVDDSIGGKCTCKITKKYSTKEPCECDLANLLRVVAEKIRGGYRTSKPNSDAVDALISRLDRHSRHKLLKFLSYQIKSISHKKAILRIRRRRAYFRRRNWSKKLRKNPRSGFDGKPVFWV